MRKKVYGSFAALIALALAALCGGCGIPLANASRLRGDTSTAAEQNAGTVRDYFPINENTEYVYEGDGNEYASYRVFVDYASEGKMQRRIDNGGTEIVRIVELSGGSATCVYERGETYFRENMLERDGGGEVLLKEPIRAGTTWRLFDGRERAITGVDVRVKTPLGEYTAIEVVTQGQNDKITDYYVKNVGLVKTVYSAGEDEISSTLSEINTSVPFAQTVRFYFPDINDGKLYYEDREIEFFTNDITRETLCEAYKHAPNGLGAVFTKDVYINSLYLGGDGMVYVDLNAAFVKDMNAGAGYEAMILACVADAFGSYYGAQKVVLTIDGGLYESGHIAFGEGETIAVDLTNAVPLSGE